MADINDLRVTEMAFGAGTAARLFQVGVTRAGQLADVDRRSRADLRSLLRDDFRTWRAHPASELRHTAVSSAPVVAVCGIADHSSLHGAIAAQRSQRADGYRLLVDRVRSLAETEALPKAFDLYAYLASEVEDQGPNPFCVGFGSKEGREFLAERWLSGPYMYRAAKERDGHPHLDGSWQAFAFQHLAEIGAVGRHLYSMDDAKNERPTSRLDDQASELRIQGFVDLLVEDDEILPDLIKAVISGRLFPGVGPHPISVSLALYESYLDPSARRDGRKTVPLPHEKRIGGHAMSIVGFIDGDAREAIDGVSYMIVKNSWGTQYAGENPLGYAGFDLIPYDYFVRGKHVWELLLGLAEPSPVNDRNPLLRRLMAA